MSISSAAPAAMQQLTLTQGQRYRTRCGEIVRIDTVSGNTASGVVERWFVQMQYAASGGARPLGGESPFDLVEEQQQ
jgi:hypothetical protein